MAFFNLFFIFYLFYFFPTSGILVNAYSGEMSSAAGEVVDGIIASVVSVLSIDTPRLIETAVDAFNQVGESTRHILG